MLLVFRILGVLQSPDYPEHPEASTARSNPTGGQIVRGTMGRQFDVMPYQGMAS